jgi:hypothetical protein
MASFLVTQLCCVTQVKELSEIFARLLPKLGADADVFARDITDAQSALVGVAGRADLAETTACRGR